MNTSPVTIKEVFDEKSFDPSTLYAAAPFTQAFFYGEWQKATGREVRRFLILDERGSEASGEQSGPKVIGAFQAIFYAMPFGKKYIYIPYGPVLTASPSKATLFEIKNNIKKMARESGAIFARTDFTVAAEDAVGANDAVNGSDTTSPDNLAKIFTKAPRSSYHSSYFQPRLEWYLDLSRSEDELMQSFHKNTRYSIRVSEKSEVATEIVSENIGQHFDTFYSVLEETAKRDGFSLHPKKYYENIFNLCNKDKNGVLVLSSYRGEVLAANLIILYGNTAMFAFGGTRSMHRDTLPAYAAQWATIKYLKSRGYRFYNFGGVSGEGNENENWRGLTAFKKRFGGHLVQHSDFYDAVASPFWYFVYNFYKKIRG